MTDKIFVYGSGAVAFLPMMSLVLFFAGVAPELTVLGYGSAIFLGMIFSLHVGRNSQIEGVHKLFWVVGLILCFPVVSIPAYWWFQILQPYRWHRKMLDWSDDLEA